METKRLILRPISLTNFDDLFALRSDPEVMKYIGDGSVRTKEEVHDFIICGLDYYQKYGLGFFSVFEKATGQFIGQAGLFHLRFDVNQPEIELACVFRSERTIIPVRARTLIPDLTEQEFQNFANASAF